MATSVSSLELLRSVRPHQSIIASSGSQIAIPNLPAIVNCSSRSVITRSSSKLRCVSVKSSIVDKLEKDDGSSSIIDDSAAAATSSPFHKMVTGAVQERDFTSTPYVPVYVILPAGTINLDCELVDPDELINQLRMLKSINVDGVVVDCWWGIVEAHAPNQYNWSGYKKLFRIVQDLNLKLQVVMCFHGCGGNAGDDLNIPLPQWVMEIGIENPDIFFTDREGRRNHECLTLGVDHEWIFRSRPPFNVYSRYMSSFGQEFIELFDNDIITEIKIGLGPSGELRYPSSPAKYGWKYPGIGEFQCYDKYMMQRLEKAAKARGNSLWGRVPDNAGSYNSIPSETGFFCDKGDYHYSDYGRFFLKWYSQSLIDHGKLILLQANTTLPHTPTAAKVPGICLWNETASHAAELTAGFYNHSKRDGYTQIGSMLRQRKNTALNFKCIELPTHDCHNALTNRDTIFSEVRRAAWNGGLRFASENDRPCYDREDYNKILENAKPLNDPLGGYLPNFSYLRLSPNVIEGPNFIEFQRFVRKMHGESVLDLESCL